MENIHNVQTTVTGKMDEVRHTFDNEEGRSKLKSRLMRTKTMVSQTSVDEDEEGGEGGMKLEKCLTTFDLISLGTGSCVGTGMYVVAGLVAKNVAGPAAMFSFLIAAIASILSGVCYAEFGVRVPKTSGSAYMYSYVTVGEFVAFLIGWNLILEYMIGSAAGASALSACFDALGNHSMSRHLEENVGTVIGKTYPDFLGFFIGLGMTVVLAGGVQKSVKVNNILNGINMVVWLIMIVVGMFYARFDNWTAVGFSPYGASGVFSGAATCFYAFIGFDIIATTGEEAKNPSKSIPIAIVVSLVVCLVAYVSSTMILTLMVPYTDISGDSALMDMFVQRGAPGMKWFVAIGAISSLTVSLLGSMFPMPRVIYAMSRDGLLFKALSEIHPRTNTPLIATILTGTLSSFMSLLVGLQILVEMMSIGTLLAYSLVSVSVLILRYQPTPHKKSHIPMANRLDPITENEIDEATGQPKKMDAESLITPSDDKPAYGTLPGVPEGGMTSKLAYAVRNFKVYWHRMGFPGDDAQPNESTGKTATIFAGALVASEAATCMVIVFAAGPLARGAFWAVILLMVLLALDGVCFVYILRQPQNKKELSFKAPAVPFLPGIAIFFNLYLMLKLPGLTWARLAIWILIGLVMYFSFSMFNSKKEQKRQLLEARENDKKQNMEAAVGAHSGGPTGDSGTQGGVMASDGMNTGAHTGSGQAHQDPTYNTDSYGHPQPTPAQQGTWPEDQRQPDRGQGYQGQGAHPQEYPRGSSEDPRGQGYEGGYGDEQRRDEHSRGDERPHGEEQYGGTDAARGGGTDAARGRPHEAPRRQSSRESTQQQSRYRGQTGWQNPYHEGGGY